MPKKISEFIAVDGEGVTRDDGTHDYVLLSVGTESLDKDGERLTYRDVFPFLYRQFQLNPDATFVGFYLSYDFTMWLQDISQDAAYMLLHKDGIASRKPKTRLNPDPFPVRFDGWEFDLLTNRRFKLRPAVQGNDQYRTENVWKWMYVCDSGPFWQTSFMNAINPTKWTEPIVTDREYEIIKKGKSKRATAHYDHAMVKYNVTENAVLEKAMSSLRHAFTEQGLHLTKKQWFGPGQAVEAWFKTFNAPRRETIEETTPREVLQAAMSTYYGGWFEVMRHGYIPGTSYEYDINSAYPYIIQSLPCLLHGKWIHRDKYDYKLAEHCRFTMLYVKTEGSNPHMGGLPYRSVQGRITRPTGVQGWYWAHEVFAAIGAGLIDMKTMAVLEQWSYDACHCLPPVREIARLYQHRLTIGKNTVQGKAIKLLINSAYGKFCQSQGMPKYGNPIYASLITAGCRTMILDSIRTHPVGASDVLMVATDGIYYRTPHPNLDLDKERLGAWDETEKQNMTLFMPGVYWDDSSRSSLADETTVSIKSRGINGYALAKHVADIDDMFLDMIDGHRADWPEVDIPIAFQIVSPKLAIARGKWNTCGKVTTDGVRHMSSAPNVKRDPYWRIEDGIVTTDPYGWMGVTHGYTRQFGLDIEAMMDNDEYLSTEGGFGEELMDLLSSETYE